MLITEEIRVPSFNPKNFKKISTKEALMPQPKLVPSWKFACADIPNEEGLWHYTKGSTSILIELLEGFGATVREIENGLYFITNHPVDYVPRKITKYILQKCEPEEFEHIESKYFWAHEKILLTIWHSVGNGTIWFSSNYTPDF